MEQNSNSVTVYIRRLPQFAMAARKELEAYFAEGQRGYGSYFAKGSARTATGLTIPEEDLLLPFILNIPKEDRDFRMKVTAHYEALDVKVPAGEGLKLEIGLTGSNTEPISMNNLPILIDDYLKYRHALGHPWMAPSEAEGKGNQLKQYYMFNPGEVSKVNINVNEQRDKALGYYLSIKDNARTVKMYLTLLGTRVDTLRKGEEILKLRELVDKTPEAFIKLYDDRDKEIKYAIEDMINNNILERINTTILVKDDSGTKLGTTMKEAIVFLQDSRNSKIYQVLRARLQEKWKATSVSVDTDEELEPAAPVVQPEKPEDLIPAESLMPAAVETDAILVEGNAAEIDD